MYWVLKETLRNKLMVFERKVLRKIFGPTKERDGTWRIKTNYELDKLIRHKNFKLSPCSVRCMLSFG